MNADYPKPAMCYRGFSTINVQ